MADYNQIYTVYRPDGTIDSTLIRRRDEFLSKLDPRWRPVSSSAAPASAPVAPAPAPPAPTPPPPPPSIANNGFWTTTLLDDRACIYCGGAGHVIRKCAVVAVDVAAGLCALNGAGKVVAPDGRFVHRSVPGLTLRDKLTFLRNRRTRRSVLPLTAPRAHTPVRRSPALRSPSPFRVPSPIRLPPLSPRASAILRWREPELPRIEFTPARYTSPVYDPSDAEVEHLSPMPSPRFPTPDSLFDGDDDSDADIDLRYPSQPPPSPELAQSALVPFRRAATPALPTVVVPDSGRTAGPPRMQPANAAAIKPENLPPQVWYFLYCVAQSRGLDFTDGSSANDGTIDLTRTWM